MIVRILGPEQGDTAGTAYRDLPVSSCYIRETHRCEEVVVQDTLSNEVFMDARKPLLFAQRTDILIIRYYSQSRLPTHSQINTILGFLAAASSAPNNVSRASVSILSIRGRDCDHWPIHLIPSSAPVTGYQLSSCNGRVKSNGEIDRRRATLIPHQSRHLSCLL